MKSVPTHAEMEAWARAKGLHGNHCIFALCAVNFIGRLTFWPAMLHMLFFPAPRKRFNNMTTGGWFELKAETLGDVAKLLPLAVNHTLTGVTIFEALDFDLGRPETSPPPEKETAR